MRRTAYVAAAQAARRLTYTERIGSVVFTASTARTDDALPAMPQPKIYITITRRNGEIDVDVSASQLSPVEHRRMADVKEEIESWAQANGDWPTSPLPEDTP